MIYGICAVIVSPLRGFEDRSSFVLVIEAPAIRPPNPYCSSFTLVPTVLRGNENISSRVNGRKVV